MIPTWASQGIITFKSVVVRKAWLVPMSIPRACAMTRLSCICIPARQPHTAAPRCTSLHLQGEDPGGNAYPSQYESLSQVPGLPSQMDPTMFDEILEVPYVFNRLLGYKSDLIHSASSYFGWGHEMASKRMAVVFFWKV